MRRVSHFLPGVAALLLLLSALIPISPAMGQDPAFDELEAKRNDLILLFDRGEFDQLDSRLNAIQHRYESGELSDMDLGDYFYWVTTFGAMHPEEYDSRLGDAEAGFVCGASGARNVLRLSGGSMRGAPNTQAKPVSHSFERCGPSLSAQDKTSLRL